MQANSPDPDVYPEVMQRQLVTNSERVQCCAQHRDPKRNEFGFLKSEIMHICASVEHSNKINPTRTKAD